MDSQTHELGSRLRQVERLQKKTQFTLEQSLTPCCHDEGAERVKLDWLRPHEARSQYNDSTRSMIYTDER